MKQPYEDVTGVDRDDFLLSLDDRADAHRDALAAAAQHLFTATHIGHPDPVTVAMLDRFRNPQPGDLVAEYSRTRSQDRIRRREGFGLLLARRVEWSHTDEQWTALAPDLPARPFEVAWYLQYGPAASDIYRWVNCHFFVVVTDIAAFDHSLPRDGDGAITVTRETLMEYLAFSGLQVLGARGSALR